MARIIVCMFKRLAAETFGTFALVFGASGFLKLLFPAHANLGATSPAGPISGASIEAIRSVAPAVVSGQFHYLWVYLAPPVLGALPAVPAGLYVQPKGC